jgi:hypothetical protein
MKIYAYRLITTDNDKIGYFGVVFASNKKELFWALDEVCDPYSCEIKQIDFPSVIGLAWDLEEDHTLPAKLEVGGLIIDTILNEEDGWKPAFDGTYPGAP